MARIPTTLVKPKHAYTGVHVPWRIEEDRDVVITSGNGRRFGWSLFRYLSGGGMAELGRTSSQEAVLRRQTRFLVIASVLLALWILFMFI